MDRLGPHEGVNNPKSIYHIVGSCGSPRVGIHANLYSVAGPVIDCYKQVKEVVIPTSYVKGPVTDIVKGQAVISPEIIGADNGGRQTYIACIDSLESDPGGIVGAVLRGCNPGITAIVN